MAQATDPQPSALIVSHGQPSDPAPAEAALRALADRVRQLLPGWTIDSATMASRGHVQRAQVRQPKASVYPLFMADGWFTGTALPDRLNEHDRACVLTPLGMDPHLPRLACDILTRALAARDWQISQTCLIIAAHGGKVSRNPAKAARKFADDMRDISGFADIRLGFIEQQPDLSEIAVSAGKRAICLPFFAANGWHVRHDIPQALGKAGFEGVTLDAIGTAAQIPDLITQSLVQHRKGLIAAKGQPPGDLIALKIL